MHEGSRDAISQESDSRFEAPTHTLRRDQHRDRHVRRSSIAALIRHRLVSAIKLGALKPGDRLASARTLAAELGADRRVILAAYTELAADGLVQMRHRSGVYLATEPGARAPRNPRDASATVAYLAREISTGVSLMRAREQLERCTATANITAACIECNDDQISSLADELSARYGLETIRADVASLADETVRDALRTVDVLVTTPAHADAVRELAIAIHKPWLAVTHQTNMLDAVDTLLAAGTVYVVVSDADHARKIRAAVSSPHNLITLVAGTDDVSVITRGAAAYVTRRARAMLGRALRDDAGGDDPTALSLESSIELLSVIVDLNLATGRAHVAARRAWPPAQRTSHRLAQLPYR